MEFREILKRIIITLMTNIHERRKLVLALSCVVVFVTAYMLILPAFTLEKTEAVKQGGIDVPGVEQTSEEDEASAGGQSETKSERSAADEEADAKTDKDADSDSNATPGKSKESKKEKAAAEEKTESPAKEAEQTKQSKSAPAVTLQNEESDDYSIAVEGRAADLSEDMSVNVREIDQSTRKLKKEYESLYNDALEAVRNEEGSKKASTFAFAKFYDISLMDGKKEVEPDSAVDVKISFSEDVRKELKVKDPDKVYIVHFVVDKDTGEVTPEVLDTKSTDITVENNKVTEAAFTTESFSVFAVVCVKELSKTVISASGEKYEVTVTYDETAEIPEGSDLTVNEILPENAKYEKYYKKALEKVAGKDADSKALPTGYARFFDIGIESDGQKIEPKAAVDVSFKLADAPADEKLAVIHFEQKLLTEVPVILDADTENAKDIRFEADSFSIYGVMEDPTGDIQTGRDAKAAKLGAAGTRVYAVEITKLVVDEQGNRIKSDNIGTAKFNIYRKSVETIPGPVTDSNGTEYLDVIPYDADEVKDLNIGAFEDDAAYTGSASGYELLREKTVQVGSDGFGLVYDYDVSPALYYVEEDPDSVKKTITDTAGKEWNYKQTYIWTEYAWRNHQNDNYMHVGKTYTKKPAEGGYKGVPEILGNHYGYNGTDGPFTNDYLEFYVYNVYESPKVDVPVIKAWPDFDGEGHENYNWQASFKLQWAPLYEGEERPSASFRDVTPVQSITINKSDMAGITQELINRYLSGDETLSEEQTAKIEAISFRDLPKYGTDSDGNTFRYQYSLEETEYLVTDTSTGAIYSWSEPGGYNDPDESTHYHPFYPHDAGETEEGNTAEANEADTNYYINVTNALRNISQKDYIDVKLDKQWDINDDGTLDTRAATYWAEFELRRFVHTEHRDLSHMSDADRVADPITITIQDGSGNTIHTLRVQPNVGLYIGGNFLPHDSEKTAAFTSDHSVQLASGSSVSTLTVTAAGENQSNALVRSQEFFVTQDTVFTIDSGSENLVAGNMAKVLDTGTGTSPLPDRSFSQTIRLDSSNRWHVDLNDLIRMETSAGDDDDQENVTFYEYYLVEKSSTPKGYAQYFRADGDGNPTRVLSGDSDHQIEHDDSIVALNGPSNRLIVKKLWRGVPDTTGFPAVKFTLYQAWADGNEGWVYENPETHASYEDIELKGNSLEWICPETLPTTRLDGSTSRAVKYYVVEDERSGSETKEGITTSWQFYYYINSKGQQTNAGHQGYFAALNGSDLAADGGTITICNKMNNYMQLDIQKQYFKLKEAGSWDNVTATAEMKKDAILGFRVIRAIKAPDGKWLDGEGNESDSPVWMDYGEEMLCGYDENGNTVVHRGDNDIFWLHDAGGDWHFRIEDNQGDATNVNAGGSGLPGYGFYIKNGEDIPVEYWYSVRETNVYKDLDRTPYPEWDWFSSITPVNAHGPNGQTMSAFPKAFQGQDSNRIANFQASDLIIDKEWIGDPAASAVYVKVWRTAEDSAPEDFTAIIAEDIRNNNNWQMYVNDPAEVDLNRNALIVRPDSNGIWEDAIKVNRALLGTLSETGRYHYYIQEVGYRTLSGEYRTNVNGTFKPLYDKWVGTASEGAYTGAPVGMNDYAGNNITIGSKGENRLKVINSTGPSTSYTVTKAFHGPQSSTGGQSSVTGKYPTDGSKHVAVLLQQRYRYEKTEDGVEYVSKDNATWVRKDSAEAATTWTVDWQAAESASPVSVTLPLDKPAGSVLSDEAWYGSAAAWTYTWEGLDVTKTLAEEADPANSRVAQLYYRAVEVSTPDWFNSMIASDEQNGHMAVDDNSQTAAGVLSEKNKVTNERNDINLNLNKVWTGLGEGKTWPDGVTIDYQLVQHFHLALADMSTTDEHGIIAPSYSTGKIFKSVDMTTTSSGASTSDSVHPQATGLNVGKPSDGSDVIARITGLPVYGFMTATAEDVTEAAKAGVRLKEGTVYPVVYTYSAKETAVKKNGNPIGFKEQTVDAELDDTVSSPVTYKATLTNELVNVTVEKVWNGLTPTTSESATIQLMRFKKDIEPEPETTFPVAVSVGEWGTGIDATNNGHITVTFSAEGKEPCSVILEKTNEWSSVVNLDKDASWNASYSGDGTVIDTTVEKVSGITEAITEETATEISLKPNKKETGLTVRVYVSSAFYNRDNGNNWGGNLDVSAMTEGYIDFVIKDPSQNNTVIFDRGHLDPQNNWSQGGISLPAKSSGQYTIEFTADSSKVIHVYNTSINIQEGQSNYEVAVQAQYTDPNMVPDTDGTVILRHSQSGNKRKVQMTPGETATITRPLTPRNSGWNITLNGAALSFIDNKATFTVSETGTTEIVIDDAWWETQNLNEFSFTGSVSGTRSRSNVSRMRSSARSAASLRAPASITWTNNTSGLPTGADPAKDELVDTITFSGSTWSKTWNELPKYSDDGKEYVYYAYETDYAGASGATALETTYSIEADGTIKVTNTPTMPNLGNLKVKKEQFYDGTLNSQANGKKFTVGLFEDEAGQNRVTGTNDQEITINNGTGEIIFSGLAEGTYYVFETVNGAPVKTSGTQATIKIDDYDYSVTYTGNPATVETGKTAEVTVKNDQIPFSLDILKEDEENTNKKLDGAVFTLYKLGYDPETHKTSHEDADGTSVTTANGGKAEFKDLALGYYEIVETKAPDGYIINDDTVFYIKVTDAGVQMVTHVDDAHPDEWPEASTTGSVVFTAAASGKKALATVPNTPGTELPHTGGIGTTIFYILGSLLVVGSAVVLISRRRIRK